MIHTFVLDKENFVYDTESGALHQFDDAAFSVFELYQKNNGRRPAEKQLENCSDGLAIAADIDALIAVGELFAAEHNVSYSQVYPEKPKFKAMCLNICHDCNLRCKYCFAETGEYGQHQRSRMSFATGKKAIDFLIANSGNRHNLDIDFFGGEPLMNFEVVKELVNYCETEGPKHQKDIRMTITTNATLLDDAKIDFINSHFKNCVLSLDGREEINDKMRPYAGGTGSYATVSENIKNFVHKRGDKEYYIRGTFTHYNLDFAKDAMALFELAPRVSVEPVIAEPDKPYAIRTSDLPEIMHSYEELARLLLARRQKGENLLFFHFMLHEGESPCIYKRLKGCGVGTEYCAVTPNGEIYPCHQLVGDEEYIIGSVDGDQAVIYNDRVKPFAERLLVTSRSQCRACWARYICGGGCTANHIHTSGSFDAVDEISCSMLQKRLEMALWLAAKSKSL